MEEVDARPVIPVLAGPTAVGKTELSLVLAEALGAEIVSADSRQVFRAMDVGTAKPTPVQLRRIRHHFIGERPPDAAYSAGAFAVDAWERIASIRMRNCGVLVVGGSTLYLEALLVGLPELPVVSPSVRAEIRHRLDSEGTTALWEELCRVDPRAAARMDRTKSQRIARALEVWHSAGRPLSSYWDVVSPPPYRFTTVVLNRERAALYARINARVDEMLAMGLVAEVASLLASGLSADAPSLRTIGYREIIAHLRGQATLEEARTLVQRNSRRYAKRQLTFFRRFPDWTWIDAADQDCLRRILATYQH